MKQELKYYKLFSKIDNLDLKKLFDSDLAQLKSYSFNHTKIER